ncbi:MarR family winged helix-turn-helix transcriptional regulator [Variovorax dokdonensis]|uniref:MarR family winged helix-turn-helix transcriptional regulator n=1 Tax=Variovorax dokdonensis TaxID=344883 RepID=A0ABT7NGE6_9BURK|nr:MarR family winged helix-turn-helix transcriptional regulator [Variovorax dokdonensis]MDM0047026.1 MarR family winged helix-turn-helix transcriptional regulator [Variovorax dokdonensis]
MTTEPSTDFSSGAAAHAAAGANASSQDELLLLRLVRVVNMAARPFAQTVGREYQLSLPEWRVMAVVARYPGSTASQVCDLCGMDKMTVSRALAGLEQSQRLERCADETDHRCTRLYLSEAGSTLHGIVHEKARMRELQLFAGTTPAERERLSATLDKVVAAMARHDV